MEEEIKNLKEEIERLKTKISDMANLAWDIYKME